MGIRKRLSSWIRNNGFLLFLSRLWHKEIILIDYLIVDEDHYTPTLRFARIHKSVAIGLGYTKSVGMRDELSYSFFPIYVKFHNLPNLPQYDCEETSETLFDHWKSDSTKEFIRGMGSTPLKLPETKKLFVIILAVMMMAGAAYVIMVMRWKNGRPYRSRA